MRRHRARRELASLRTSFLIAVFLSLLVLSMPFAHAALLNLTYDANGNLVTGDGKYRTYNSKNQLVSIRDGNNVSAAILQTYVYHPIEERILVKKTYNSTGSVTETVTYVSDAFVRVTNSTGTYNTTYVLAGGDQIAQVLPNGAKEFLLGDNEGSASITTNSTGGVVERTSYTPYGAVASGGAATRFNYEGREDDPVSGDTDFRFRKYRPEWGIFTQPDNIIQDSYDPQTFNRYAFENNNPLRYEDPTGHYSGSGGVLAPVNRADGNPGAGLLELSLRFFGNMYAGQKNREASALDAYALQYPGYAEERGLPEEPFLLTYEYEPSGYFGEPTMVIGRVPRVDPSIVNVWYESRQSNLMIRAVETRVGGRAALQNDVVSGMNNQRLQSEATQVNRIGQSDYTAMLNTYYQTQLEYHLQKQTGGMSGNSPSTGGGSRGSPSGSSGVVSSWNGGAGRSSGGNGCVRNCGSSWRR